MSASIPVKGTTREIPGWVETGLMLFSTAFLKRTGFTRKYDWPVREVRPTPEYVVPGDHRPWRDADARYQRAARR